MGPPKIQRTMPLAQVSFDSAKLSLIVSKARWCQEKSVRAGRADDQPPEPHRVDGVRRRAAAPTINHPSRIALPRCRSPRGAPTRGRRRRCASSPSAHRARAALKLSCPQSPSCGQTRRRRPSTSSSRRRPSRSTSSRWCSGSCGADPARSSKPWVASAPRLRPWMIPGSPRRRGYGRGRLLGRLGAAASRRPRDHPRP